MRELTPRQKQILEMIQEFISDTGMPPTRAEIARQLGLKSANAAEEHLRALQRKGVLELLPGASRGIQLKDSLREQMGLPLAGLDLQTVVDVDSGQFGRLRIGATPAGQQV